MPGISSYQPEFSAEAFVVDDKDTTGLYATPSFLKAVTPCRSNICSIYPQATLHRRIISSLHPCPQEPNSCSDALAHRNCRVHELNMRFLYMCIYYRSMHTCDMHDWFVGQLLSWGRGMPLRRHWRHARMPSPAAAASLSGVSLDGAPKFVLDVLSSPAMVCMRATCLHTVVANFGRKRAWFLRQTAMPRMWQHHRSCASHSCGAGHRS
eukprot:2263123-Amphidinium_carterae.2